MSIDTVKHNPYPRGVAGKRRTTTDPSTPHTLVVKGLTSAEVAQIDALVDERNAALAEQGASTSRNAVIVAALRDLIARRRAK